MEEGIGFELDPETWGTTAANELVKIRVQSDLSDEAKEKRYRAIIAKAQGERIRDFFTTPTILTPLLQFFSAKTHIEPEDILKGDVEVRTYLEFKSPKSHLKLQTTLLDGISPFEVERFEEELRRRFSPAGLKIVMGLFRAAHDQGRHGVLVLEMDKFCDSLGYTPDSKGYHRSRNTEQIIKTLRTLQEVEVIGQITRHNPNGSKDVAEMKGPLIHVKEQFALYHSNPGQTERDKIAEGMTIEIHEALYADITKKKYSWVDRDYLKINAGQHPHAIQLVPFYVNQWRMGWQKYEGIYRAKLGVILRRAGIGITNTQQSRVIRRVKEEHDYLVEQGLIKSWQIVGPASKPLNELWEVVIPDRHVLKMLMSGKTALKPAP